MTTTILVSDSSVVFAAGGYGWSGIQSGAGFLGGIHEYSNTGGAAVTFTFTGTGAQIIGNNGPGQGSFLLSVDGGGESTVSQVGTADEQAVVYDTGTLSGGSHTLYIQVISGWVDLSGILVTNPPFVRETTFAGGTPGDAITTANSGGTSGDAFDSATGTTWTYDITHVAPGFTVASKNDTSGSNPAHGRWESGEDIAKIYFWMTVYVPALPASFTTFFTAMQPGGGVCGFIGIDSSDGKVKLWRKSGPTLMLTSASTLPLNQHVRIEGYIICDGSGAGGCEFKIFNDINGTVADDTQTTGNFYDFLGPAQWFRVGNDNTYGSGGVVYIGAAGVSEVGYHGPAVVGGANTVTVTSPGDQTGVVGTAITTLDIVASDSDITQTLTYTATGLPAGLSIDASTGHITGTPTTAGSNSVVITVTDTTSVTGTASFNWPISAPAGNTVTVTNPGDQTGTVGTPITELDIVAVDSDGGETLTYSATGLPAGLSIDTSTGAITGTPTTAGAPSVTVTATDTTSAFGSATFTWTISAAAGVVTVTNPGDQETTIGTPVTLDISATDTVGTETLTYGVTGLPTGLTIDTSTGVISGTPTSAGSHSVVVTAYGSGGGSDTADFGWLISSGVSAGLAAHYAGQSDGTPAVYVSSFEATDITDLTVIQHKIGFATTADFWGDGGSVPWPNAFNSWDDGGQAMVSYVLHDSDGKTITCGNVFDTKQSHDTTQPKWTLVSSLIPQDEDFDYTNLVSIVSTVTNFYGTRLFFSDVFLDDLTVCAPAAGTALASLGSNGAVFPLSIKGTAHAPLSLAFSQGGDAFNTLIVHTPGPHAPPSWVPMVDIPPEDSPDGTTGYPFAQLLPNVNARFQGNYSVVLDAVTISAGSHTVIVTFTPYEYEGGPAGEPVSVTRAFLDTDITNGLVVFDEVTLPPADLVPDSIDGYLAVSITDTDPTDSYQAVMVLDTMGVVMLVNVPGDGYPEYWIDAPTADRDFSPVMGGSSRSRAASVLGWTRGGGALMGEPGTSRLFVYSRSGIPELTGKYHPAWQNDALS